MSDDADKAAWESMPPVPDQFMIDPKLVERWFAIAPHDPIEFAIPRFAMDALYSAVERSYASVAALADLMSVEAADAEERAKAVVTLQTSLILGLNALRTFQTVVMSGATDTPLDESGKVPQEGHQDGK